jgi:hypothetical protein
VQEQGQGIDAHHLMEQSGQIVVRADRFRDGQQGSVGVAGGSRLSVKVNAGHGETPGQSLVRNGLWGKLVTCRAAASYRPAPQVGPPAATSQFPPERTVKRGGVSPARGIII